MCNLKSSIRIITLLTMVGGLGPSVPAQAPPERFTLEETVLLAKGGHSPDALIAMRAKLDPAALPHIYAMLDDPTQWAHWESAAQFLGVLAGEEDLPELLAYISNQKNSVLPENHRNLITGVIRGLGVMEMRGIGEASETLDSMMNVEYWKNLGIMSNINDSMIGRDFEFAYFVNNIKANTGDPKFVEKLDASIARIQDPREKATMTRDRSGFVNQYERRQRALILHSGGKASPETESRLSNPQPSKLVRPSKSQYMNLFQSRQTRVDLTSATARLALWTEAAQAFERIAEALRNGDYPYVVQRIADDGRPVLLIDEVTSDSLDALLKNEKLMAALEEQKRLLEKPIRSLDPVETPARWINGYRFTNSSAAAFPHPGPDPKESFDLIVLHLSMPALANSKSREPQFFSNQGTVFPETLAESAPIVTMIWQSGRWYWNPFGW